VWRWQERFMAEGVPGPLRDKTRPAPIPSLGSEVEARAVAATQTAAPGETTHWTSVAMAKHIGIIVRSVQRIWRKHGLQPHRVYQFKLSNDPRFAAKVLDIVGPYVAPPEPAVVRSIDEKSQIQALDRTQPGLPMKKGRCGTMTNDYKRHGTTTLFAALNVLDGTVIGRCMQRHRHQEFIRFLNVTEKRAPSVRFYPLAFVWRADSPDAWEPSVSIGPLVSDRRSVGRAATTVRPVNQTSYYTRRIALHDARY
jgi:hypothetical protein